MDVRLFVGKNVERLRRAKLMADGRPMTQIALADALDRDRAYISGLERGTRNATIVSLYRIAEVLGVPFSALFAVPKGEAGPTSAPRERERSGQRSTR